MDNPHVDKAAVGERLRQHMVDQALGRVSEYVKSAIRHGADTTEIEQAVIDGLKEAGIGAYCDIHN